MQEREVEAEGSHADGFFVDVDSSDLIAQASASSYISFDTYSSKVFLLCELRANLRVLRGKKFKPQCSLSLTLGTQRKNYLSLRIYSGYSAI